jgi:hypothetical protein
MLQSCQTPISWHGNHVVTTPTIRPLLNLGWAWRGNRTRRGDQTLPLTLRVYCLVSFLSFPAWSLSLRPDGIMIDSSHAAADLAVATFDAGCVRNLGRRNAKCYIGLCHLIPSGSRGSNVPMPCENWLGDKSTIDEGSRCCLGLCALLFGCMIGRSRGALQGFAPLEFAALRHCQSMASQCANGGCHLIGAY